MKVRDLINEVQSIKGEEYLVEGLSEYFSKITNSDVLNKIKKALAIPGKMKTFNDKFNALFTAAKHHNDLEVRGSQDPKALENEIERDREGAFFSALQALNFLGNLPSINGKMSLAANYSAAGWPEGSELQRLSKLGAI